MVDERRAEEDDLTDDNLMAMVVRLEKSRSPADLLQAVNTLRARLAEPGDRELHRAFADWVRQAAERLTPRGAELPPVRTLEEVRMTLVERVAEWPKQWLREGLEQGREQGLAHERALLRRQAASRFGEDTAARLSEALAQINDPERLAEVGEWLVRCDTGAELLARVVGKTTEAHLLA